MATDDAGEVTTTGNDIKRAVEQHDELSRILEVEIPYKNDRHVMVGDRRVSQGATGVIWFPADQE